MYLIWKQNGNVLKDTADSGSLVFPVTFPGTVGDPQTLNLQSSARAESSYYTLQNVKFYLDGDVDQLNTILNVWPNYGNNITPQRPDFNGGIEISLDNGYSFIRLGYDASTGARVGFPDDPSTWIDLQPSAVQPGSGDGVLGAFDLATIIVRYRVPALADQFEVFKVRLEAAFDVV